MFSDTSNFEVFGEMFWKYSENVSNESTACFKQLLKVLSDTFPARLNNTSQQPIWHILDMFSIINKYYWLVRYISNSFSKRFNSLSDQHPQFISKRFEYKSNQCRWSFRKMFSTHLQHVLRNFQFRSVWWNVFEIFWKCFEWIYSLFQATSQSAVRYFSCTTQQHLPATYLTHFGFVFN